MKSSPQTSGAEECRVNFLAHFPEGFSDPTYFAWERDYKWAAHKQWEERLGRSILTDMLSRGRFGDIALEAVRIESKTNLLFSFEKMALRDALKARGGARAFALGLNEFFYGPKPLATRFQKWCEVVESLPRQQTRVLTWPLVTVFGFLAQPHQHLFLKPNVTRHAAERYGFDFRYQSRPQWGTYENLLQFAQTVKRDLADLRPRDMVDIQSFLWVQGSDEYAS